MNDFIKSGRRGGQYLLHGITDFFRYPFLWRYCTVPMLITVICDAGFFYFLKYYLLEYAAAFFRELVENSWILSNIAECFENFFPGLIPQTALWLYWSFSIFSLAQVNAAVFQTVSFFFFPAMIRCFEEKVLKIFPVQMTFRQKCFNFFESLLVSVFLIICVLVFNILMIFFPVVGFLITGVICGYFMALLFMSESACNRGIKVTQLSRYFHGKRGIISEFGFYAFLLMQIPFLNVICYPGFHLGASRMIDQEI